MTLAKQQRDEEIRRLRANGEPPAKIAKKFGVSASRVSQITHHAKPAAKTTNKRINLVSDGIQTVRPTEVVVEEVTMPQTTPYTSPEVGLQSLLTRYLLQAIVDTASAHSTAERIRLLDNLIVEFARLRNEM